MQHDIFLSHTWRRDGMGRDTHARVKSLCAALRKIGWAVWIDDEQLRAGNIDVAMAGGIDASVVFVACITREYIEKVNAGLSSMRARDNCANEWAYAVARRKPMVAVILDVDLLDAYQWPAGPVAMHLAANMFINASDDDWRRTAAAIDRVITAISAPPVRRPTSLRLPSLTYATPHRPAPRRASAACPQRLAPPLEPRQCATSTFSTPRQTWFLCARRDKRRSVKL